MTIPSRILFHSIFILCCLSVSAQQPYARLGGMSAHPAKAEKPNPQKSRTVVNLPFFDDFSYASHRPDPSMWLDEEVYVNQTWGKHPITLGMASFDGLDENGFPYDLNAGDSATDALTSQPIDLSSAQDSVILSFFWQRGGNAEEPSADDSLTLQFYRQINDSVRDWQSVWRQFGSTDPDTVFNYATVGVDSADFVGDFQFRFVAYGNRKGAFDVWNVDNILLDQGRSFDDSLGFDDVSFTRPAPSLLNSFEAMPWFHYGEITARAENRTSVRLHYRQHLKQSNVKTINLAEYTIREGGTVLDNGLPRLNIDDNHGLNEEIEFIVPDPSQTNKDLEFLLPDLPRDTSFTIEMVNTWDGSEQARRRPNDTIVRQQHFGNYYAYDDGSAERAFEVIDNGGGFVLNEYDVQVASGSANNVLKGLYIYFLPAQFNISRNSFSILIAENDDGRPGNLIYETDSLYQPQFTSSDFYLPYVLDTSGIEITSSVFIGIRQQKNTKLPIGFDMNSGNRNTTFFGTFGDLYQSFISGTVMMRPFFKYLPADISLPEEAQRAKPSIAVYPNPVGHQLSLDYDKQEIRELQYRIYGLTGQIRQSGVAEDRISVENLPEGIYLLHLKSNDTVLRKKIRVER